MGSFLLAWGLNPRFCKKQNDEGSGEGASCASDPSPKLKIRPSGRIFYREKLNVCAATGAAREAIEHEVDDCVGQEGDNHADDCVEDGVFGCSHRC